jgi:hypothetical protein
MGLFISEGGQAGDTLLATSVRTAFLSAVAAEGKLGADLLALEGMSGRKYRLFINNLIGSLHDARYLEVGVWMGSTLCSAIDQNSVTALAIDNWSEFDGPAQKFYTNLAKYKHPRARVSFLEKDFREVDYSGIGTFGVYLFDGPHSVKDQRDGVVVVQAALDDQFVLIVDDWNWAGVREGTMLGIQEASLVVDYSVEVRTALDNIPITTGWGQTGDWHNGYFIAALSKLRL